MSSSKSPPCTEEPNPLQPLIDILSPYKPFIASLPFLLFASESMFATTCFFIYAHTDRFLKLIFSHLLAVNIVLSGLLHFFPPMYKFYTSMIFLPFKTFWLYSTGILLLLSGTGLTFLATQPIAAKTLVATLILMFPGNVVCVVQKYPRDVVFDGSYTKALLRLPLQVTFVIWAWWFTTP